MINKCKRCGGEFSAKGAWTKYCEACRKRVRAENSAARTKITIDGNPVLAGERQRLGLTVRDMAEHLGVSEYTYYNAEHYGKAPGTVMQKKMAERLGMTPEQVFGRVLYYRVCRSCHNTYQTEVQSSKLCPECRQDATRKARDAATKIDRIPRGNQKKIAAIAAIARQAGTSYGMFVAEERKNRYGQSKT